MYICIHMSIYTYVHLDMINLSREGIYHTPLYSRGTQEYIGIRNCDPPYSYQPPAGGCVRGVAAGCTYIHM